MSTIMLSAAIGLRAASRRLGSTASRWVPPVSLSERAPARHPARAYVSWSRALGAVQSPTSLSPAEALTSTDPEMERERLEGVADAMLGDRLEEVVEAVAEANDGAAAAREEAAERAGTAPSPTLPFQDPKEAFRARPTSELLRAIAVFHACRIGPLVRNSEMLLNLAKKVFGATLVNAIVRRTFYRQFVAGGDAESIRPTLDYLAANGIHTILDYAAEDDVEATREAQGDESAAGAGAGQVADAKEAEAGEGTGPGSAANASGPSTPTADDDLEASLLDAPVHARTYAYEGEAVCDARAAVFIKAIEAAGSGGGQGFAAIKVTALGVPRLLERVSTALDSIRDLFRELDLNGDGLLHKEEWAEAYRALFTGATDEEISAEFEKLDAGGDGRVDALEWCDGITVHDMRRIASRCREEGPFSRAVLSDEELVLFNATLARVDALASAAAHHDVRLLVDAEHSYFQPVIDHVVAKLQAVHNKDRPVLYNTYQCYLTASHDRIREDLERAKRTGTKFGAKLVRGAYMVLERRHAEALGRPSPIHATIEDTHASYDGAVEMLLPEVRRGVAEFMVATHNQRSVERAVAAMAAAGLPPSAPVTFGQLLGMADNLTFVLGSHGYGAYKYVPYGTVDEVMPYLLRRAQENSDILGGIDVELRMMKREVWRRLTGRS